MRKLIVVLLLASIALGAAGVYVLTLFYDPTPGRHASLELAPADALFYAHVSLDPSNIQKRALRGILSRFPGADTFEEGKTTLGRLLDPLLSEVGLRFKRDVDPWLGDEVGLFVATSKETRDPESVALLLDTDDEAAARRAAERALEQGDPPREDKSYRDIEYRAFEGLAGGAYTFIDGFLVVGTEEGIRDAIGASHADSLAGETQYEELTAPLSEDHLVHLYANVPAILAQVTVDPDTGSLFEALGVRDGSGATALSLRVEAGRGLLEATTSVGTGLLDRFADAITGESPLPQLPVETWAAVGVPDFGNLGDAILEAMSFADEFVEERFREVTGLDLRADVLPWMEEGALFLSGDSLLTLGGALVIGSKDSPATIGTLEAVAERLGPELPGSVRVIDSGGLEGFELRGVAPAPITVLGGERLIAAYGGIATRSAVSSDETLGETDLFRRAVRALGDEQEVVLFVDLDRVAMAVDKSLPAAMRGSYERDVEPFLKPLTYAVAGAGRIGDVFLQRAIVGVE
jgi:hypothetical protein